MKPSGICLACLAYSAYSAHATSYVYKVRSVATGTANCATLSQIVAMKIKPAGVCEADGSDSKMFHCLNDGSATVETWSGSTTCQGTGSNSTGGGDMMGSATACNNYPGTWWSQGAIGAKGWATCTWPGTLPAPGVGWYITAQHSATPCASSGMTEFEISRMGGCIPELTSSSTYKVKKYTATVSQATTTSTSGVSYNVVGTQLDYTNVATCQSSSGTATATSHAAAMPCTHISAMSSHFMANKVGNVAITSVADAYAKLTAADTGTTSPAPSTSSPSAALLLGLLAALAFAQ